MNLEDFRRLSATEKAALVNKRLSEVENAAKQFKCEELDFSYAAAYTELKSVGYERHGNAFRLELTDDEITALKELASNRSIYRKAFSLGAQIVETPGEDAKTTTVRVNPKIWSDWQEFCKKHSAFNSTDMLNTALVKFMKSVND